MKYRVYIDEVGNPDLKSSSDPNHRFLSLTGVIFDLNYVRLTLHPELEALKSKYFNSHPDDPAIFHRKELLNAKHPFEALNHERTRRQFDEDLVAHLIKWDYTVISVCLDKKKHRETYTVWRYDPYHYCLAVLLERYLFFLEKRSVVGDVMAESRGGKEDRRLKDSFLKLWKNGTDYVSSERMQKALTSKQLKIKSKKNNVSGLQIADILAHPSRNEILKNNDLLHRDVAPFAQRIIEILKTKYYKEGNRIFGKKLL